MRGACLNFFQHYQLLFASLHGALVRRYDFLVERYVLGSLEDRIFVFKMSSLHGAGLEKNVHPP